MLVYEKILIHFFSDILHFIINFSAQDLPVIKTSADFDKLKQLIGDWEGK